MPFFLDETDESQRALADAAARIAAEVARRSAALPGAWSGVATDDLRAAIEALDPLPTVGVPFEDVVAEVGAAVLAHAIRPTDRATVAHLHSPTLITAAATELAIGATNQSMDSYDQAPAATLVEDHLVRRLAATVGLPSSAAGVMTAGGTSSNLLGLVLAREAAARFRGLDVAGDGLPSSASGWRIVASEAAHFSVARSATLLGLGRRAVATVATGANGSIDPTALDATLGALRAEGAEVIAIVGTAGTTDLGAVDPLALLAERARSLGAWFHVDAAVGGAFAVSDRLRPRLAGIELADSVTIDLHKLWWQPISASALLVADDASFALVHEHSEYLDREEDADTGVLNLVGRSLDTSRRFDALKALVSLRATGVTALAGMLEHLVDTTTDVAAIVSHRPEFELLAEPTSAMVVFRWIGAGPAAVAATDAELDRVNTETQRRLFESGRAVIGRTRHRDVVALKFTLVNPGLTTHDLVRLLDEISAEASGLAE